MCDGPRGAVVGASAETTSTGTWTCSGQRAEALDSRAFADPLMLHCMHRLQLGRTSGGQCVESSAGQLEEGVGCGMQGAEGLASL
eukprot:12567844-Alexandrium_andersonii.AAC.1